MSHIKIHETAFDFLYHSNNALKKENQRIQKQNKLLTRKLKAKDFIPLPIVTIDEDGFLTGGHSLNAGKILEDDEWGDRKNTRK